MPITNISFRRRAAAGAATVALGGVLAACGSSAPTATTTTGTGAAATPAASTRGMPPGLGKQVAGAAAAKATAAALARYPGTAERVVQLPNGSYEVHVLRKSGGEVHVVVSKSFAVTGTEKRPAGAPGGPGFGKAVTGTAAVKAKAAALAKYPGTAERVVQLPDGSYEVHVLRKPGAEVHVRVSKDFEVTGTESGPPAGAQGAPPAASGTATQS